VKQQNRLAIGRSKIDVPNVQVAGDNLLHRSEGVLFHYASPVLATQLLNLSRV
jgi:hypothetical protein